MEMLVYPEILDLERLKNIDQMSDILNRFWMEEVIPDSKYFSNGPSAKFLSKMSSLGLTKQKVPYAYNGLELTATESAKILETLGKNTIPINYLSSQNIVQEIVSSGREIIKDKYFDHIVKDGWNGSVCLSESHAEFDVRLCETNVTWSDLTKQYVLNGQKIWVANADIADFFIVFAKHNGQGAFLVDKTKPGITINKHLENDYFIVDFKDTPLEDSDILAERGSGFEVASKIQSLSMFYYSSGIVGLLKDMFDHTTQFLMYRPFLQKYCADFDTTQITLAKLSSDIYALESMIYFTANLIDGYEKQDCEVEMAVLKLFASQVSHNVATNCIDLLGPHVTMHSYQYPFLETFNTIKRLSHLNVSDDLMKLFVAIKCIEHNKSNLTDYIRKIRNPYLYVNDAFKHQMYLMRNDNDNPKLDLNISYNLHPSLKYCADALEYCVKRLEFANIKLLERYGAETYDHHYSLLRVTNIITEIYAMTSTLARASRSYCTGIQNCDFEIRSAEMFCQEAHKNVKQNISEIVSGPYVEVDVVGKMLAKKILDVKGYYAQHPLARNIV
ncbi:acyl-CoA dehydrogenase family member 9, mitochondrial [Diaphorina citri]|uniref:Acyl-CoA dehydrogenase family member 9, mitochondrial n=1 Tax=Diaphorina citri TaxID=121845 RepID=A0A1S3DQR8_DIACI|nr:acyl-CoA dehydrogenase family member 9, mitochondrial [Diaphorina citri]